MELLKPGQVVCDGKFLVQEYINCGGQGLVFRGVNVLRQNNDSVDTVLIKQYFAQIKDEAQAQQFVRFYIRLCECLDDIKDSLCLPLDFQKKPDCILAIYPWIDGKTLGEILFSQGVTHEQALGIAMELVRLVGLLHDRGVVHADLHPDNILVICENGSGAISLRLIDFDGSRVSGISSGEVPVGLDEYRSPEHCFLTRFGPINFHSDIFSLGVLLFIILFGRHPFAFSEGAYEKIFNKPLISLPASRLKELHNDVVQGILDCLAITASERPSALELLVIFEAHRRTGFRPNGLVDIWADPKRCYTYVRIRISAVALEFERTYHSSVIIDDRQLRGCPIKITGKIRLLLSKRRTHWQLQLQGARDDIRYGNVKLAIGRPVRVLSEQTLVIDNVCFVMSVVRSTPSAGMINEALS